jgi:hypothetical protein
MPLNRAPPNRRRKLTQTTQRRSLKVPRVLEIPPNGKIPDSFVKTDDGKMQPIVRALPASRIANAGFMQWGDGQIQVLKSEFDDAGNKIWDGNAEDSFETFDLNDSTMEFEEEELESDDEEEKDDRRRMA